MGNLHEAAYGVYQKGTTTSTVVVYSMYTSSASALLPTEWGPNGGFWIGLTSTARAGSYLLSSSSVTSCQTITGSLTGTRGLYCGGYLPSGVEKPVFVPRGCTYMAWTTDGSGTSNLVVELRSDIGFQK